jgi:hypothetical protein
MTEEEINESLDLLLETLEPMMACGKWQDVDTFLMNVGMQESTEYLAGCVYFTSSVSEYLKSWGSVFKKIFDELDSRGEDSNDIFAGIL